MSRRDACHKSRSRRLFPVTACCMRSLSISLKRHSQTNKSGPQGNKHVHRLVPSTPSCTGYMCHRLPPAARSTPASAPAHALLPPMPHRDAMWPPPVLIGNRPHVTCPAPPPSPQRLASPEGASLSTSRYRFRFLRHRPAPPPTRTFPPQTCGLASLLAFPPRKADRPDSLLLRSCYREMR